LSYDVEFIKESLVELKKLDNSAKKIVVKAIEKVAANPISRFEGGYGTPLGNMRGKNLTGLYKIKIKNLGVRIVYKLYKEKGIMRVIAIGMRDDFKVYDDVAERINK
jgi:mRNA interferase RelE/StbE